MKLFKTFAATAAVAAITMLSSCQDITEADDDKLADYEITRYQKSIYNAYGKGVSGLDVVTNTLISGTVTGAGEIVYTAADSAIIDFKTINSLGRASTLEPKLKSLNGTKYALVNADEYENVTKSIRKFKEKLMDIADTASSDSLTYDAADPSASHFVASLGKDGARGYALVSVTAFDPEYNVAEEVGTKDQKGKVDIEYYYITKAAATADYKED